MKKVFFCLFSVAVFSGGAFAQTGKGATKSIKPAHTSEQTILQNKQKQAMEDRAAKSAAVKRQKVVTTAAAEKIVPAN